MKRKNNETAADAFTPTITNAPPQVITETPPPSMPTAVMPVAIDAGAIIAAAASGGASVETMEKLLAMRRELKAEWAREQYFSSLARFQSECPPIKKDRDVMQNGKKRYSYAPLDSIIDQVKSILERHGFSYTVTVKQDAATPGQVTAGCNAHHRDGHTEYTEFTVPIDYESYMNASQKVASALTYAKRYAFCNAFGIMTSDDDDDSNSQEAKAGAPTPPPAKATPPAVTPAKINFNVCPRTKNKIYDGKEWGTIPIEELNKFYAHFSLRGKNPDGTINETNAAYAAAIDSAKLKAHAETDSLDNLSLAEIEAAAAKESSGNGELFGGTK